MRGWHLRHLAKLIGRSHNWLSERENDIRPVPNIDLENIEAVFDLELNAPLVEMAFAILASDLATIEEVRQALAVVECEG